MKHTFQILIGTFIFGFLSGFILYLYNNTGSEARVPVLSEESSVTEKLPGFQISAYRYGGCARALGCDAYRIMEDGAYTYTVRSRSGGEIQHGDTLEVSDFESIVTTLNHTKLGTVEKSTFTGTCPVEHDGTGYRYSIVVNSREYRFDTCKQALGQEPLFKLLETYFDTFEERHSTP